MASYIVTLYWRDNNGKRAESRAHYSGSLTVAAVADRALVLAAAAAAVSSAALVRMTVEYRTYIVDPPAPSLDSDAEARLLLFYGNDAGAATLSVPSPGALPLDVVGPYRNVRLDMAAPAVSTLLADLGDSLASAVTPGGDAWPMPLLAGGVTRYGEA